MAGRARLDGLISRESAKQDYGVVLTESLQLDLAATERERDALAAAADRT